MHTYLAMIDGRMSERNVDSNHLSAETLAAYLDDRLTPADRAASVAHLAECADCRRETTALRRLLANAAPRRPRMPVIAAAAAVLLFTLVPRLIRVDSSASSTLKVTERLAPAESTPVIAIAAPADSAVVSVDGLLFRWRATGSEATYHLAVQDSTGGVVWATAVSDTTAALSPDVALVKGGRYYWSVSAQLADGRSVKSGMHRFIVR
jgi:hypothetical protein